jgi:hypothetical protein
MSATNEAMCIGCGCTDSHACYDEIEDCACHWRRVDRAIRLGVCSACRQLESAWDAGDRKFRVPVDPADR